jgi:hypothetical protein
LRRDLNRNERHNVSIFAPPLTGRQQWRKAKVKSAEGPMTFEEGRHSKLE